MASVNAFSDTAQATIYYSLEKQAELPSHWKGFLADHRQLRLAGASASNKLLPSLLRQEYQAALDRLLNRRDQLNASELADAGALALRLGQTDTALNILQKAAREHPQHFAIRSNLASAWHLASNLSQAGEELGVAITLAPAAHKKVTELHRQLVRHRLRSPNTLDALFPIRYWNETEHKLGRLTPDEARKLPADAVALVQHLALSFPSDGQLLWQLAELACVHGDPTTAVELLDLCMGEYGMTQPELRRSRSAIKQLLERNTIREPLDQTKLHTNHIGTPKLAFKSRRPLIPRPLDVSSFAATRPGEPSLLLWPLLAETSNTPDRFAPRFHSYLQKLNKAPVTLTGFLHPLTDDLDCTSFLLVENPIGCWYCTAPDLTGMVFITMKENTTIRFTRDVIQVTGKLKLNNSDPEEFLFTIEESKVIPVR
jgi:protein involved in temperature-dependent protein secretion